MRLVLIRHTKTAGPAARVCGRTDVGLASSYEGERTTLFDGLRKEWTPNRIVCSPLLRARRLADDAALAFGAAGMKAGIDPRLTELDFGEWEGRNWDDIDRGQLDAWAAEPVDFRCPGGESYQDLLERVGSALEDLRSGSGRCVWIFCHAGPIRASLAHALQLPPAALFSVEIEHGRASAIDWANGRARLLYLNR